MLCNINGGWDIDTILPSVVVFVVVVVSYTSASYFNSVPTNWSRIKFSGYAAIGYAVMWREKGIKEIFL